MKKLTRVKLINWHRFWDETIDFGDSTLISGENGAGKSTLLDAIQFVITCSTNHFNKAAHENGKRKLTGYIRCKTGQENHPYERTGEISAHVACEFYEESRKRYFIVGAVIDSATEGQETVVRYLMDNVTLDDTMFKNGNRPRNITEFRSYNSKNMKLYAKTIAEGKKIMKQRFGRIEDKFFQLIPKALAFKPIDDIKDFVYSYVLDEKEVNIDTLRENVRSYQELEKTLEGVKKRIEKLEQITKQHDAVMDCIRANEMYEFFLAQAELDRADKEIRLLHEKIRGETFRLNEIEAKCRSLRQELEGKEEIRNDLLIELSSNEDYQALEKLKTRLEQLNAKQKVQHAEQKLLLDAGRKALSKISCLAQTGDLDDRILSYETLLGDLKNAEDIAGAQELISKVIEFKKEQAQKLQEKMILVKGQILEKDTKLSEYGRMLERLSHQKFSYPEMVEKLQGRIEQDFLKLGRTEKPGILCEMLEIKDEKWRNAVEGYLNTQRFYLLVEPGNFDIALGSYEKMRREKRMYGVGLINTGKLDAYDEAPEGSLAQVVDSKNLYARRYINMVLGKVQMCEKAEELKNYPVAITPGCMRYQNHVASAIRPDIYETPFIGENAVKVQFRQLTEKCGILKEEKKKLQTSCDEMLAILKGMEIEDDMDVKFRITVLSDIRRTALETDNCKNEIRNLEKNATLIEKQIRADELRNECRELNQLIDRTNKESGSCENRIEEAGRTLADYEIRRSESRLQLDRMSQKAGENLTSWKREYEKQTKDKTIEQFQQNFDRRRKANLTVKEAAEQKMKDAMYEYKTAFDFGVAATLEAYPEYALVRDRLIHSELLTYEEKVTKARLSAEEEFREQFLSRLQENMKQAQTEFRELNAALKDITFSNEHYEFIYLPSKAYGKYYDMIMDDFNVVQGESIFSGLFHETHREVIDELFARLALDRENGVKALDEFVDYRTYMDYDIRITHTDGNYSLYSKVCEEKSGGETQTPFYVTVAASFVQLYKNNIGGEAIGLVMFDEAFNNMDDERIGAVLSFMNKLPLQLVIAAPPDKIQYIGPMMQETLLVMTDNHASYIEEYRIAKSGQ